MGIPNGLEGGDPVYSSFPHLIVLAGRYRCEKFNGHIKIKITFTFRKYF